MIETPVVETEAAEAEKLEVPSTKEEPIKETGYTQISIFDDDDE